MNSSLQLREEHQERDESEHTNTKSTYDQHIFTFLRVISEQLAGIVALCIQTDRSLNTTQHSLLDGLVLSLTDATPHEMRHIKT